MQRIQGQREIKSHRKELMWFTHHWLSSSHLTPLLESDAEY